MYGVNSKIVSIKSFQMCSLIKRRGRIQRTSIRSQKNDWGVVVINMVNYDFFVDKWSSQMIKDLSTNIVYLSIENLTVPNEKGFWSSVKKSNSCTVVGPVPTHTSRPSPRPRFDARNTRHRLDTSRTRDHGRTDPRLGPRDEEHSRH